MRFPFYSNIAGVEHYCTEKDEGNYDGYIKAEENNQYDSNAIAVYTNNGKLIGYIPKDENINFRIWSKGKTDFRCNFKIKHTASYYFPFDTSLTIIDNSYLVDENNPLYGKNIAFSGDFVGLIYADEMKGFCKSFGAIVGPVNKNTDIVVYDYGATEAVKNKLESGNYHFKMMFYLDVIKLAVSTNKENRFYGKNVAFAFNYNGVNRKYRYILQYLLENGANVYFKYKKSIDILIERKGSSKLKAVIEAEKDGKEIITDNDLIRSFGYEISDNVTVIENASTVSEIVSTVSENELDTKEPKTEIKRNSANKKQKQGNGCMASILFLTLLGAFITSLLVTYSFF